MAATKPIREINTRGGRVTLVRASKVNELIRKINALYNIELQPAGLGNIRTSDHNTVIDLRQLNKVLAGDSGQETAQGSGAFTGGGQAGTEGTEYATIADLLQQIQDQQATIDALEEQIEQVSLSSNIIHEIGDEFVPNGANFPTRWVTSQVVVDNVNVRNPVHRSHDGKFTRTIATPSDPWLYRAESFDSNYVCRAQYRVLNPDRTIKNVLSNQIADRLPSVAINNRISVPANGDILQVIFVRHDWNAVPSVTSSLWPVNREWIYSGTGWVQRTWSGL